MYDQDPSSYGMEYLNEEFSEYEPYVKPKTPPLDEGTGRIFVDRFGFYLPPPKRPKPSFPRPLKPEDVEELEKWAAAFQTVSPAPEIAFDIPVEDRRQIVRRYTLNNSNGVTVQIINYGATVTSIKVPDKNDEFGDVLLGFENMPAYQSENNQFLGATLGRYSSILSDGKFTLGNQEFLLTQNSGQHHTVGGYYGFDKMMWDSCIYKNKVIMTYVSESFEEGYPGQLMVQIHFSLSRNNIFTIHTTAVASKPTVISLANHLLFNLAGHGAGPKALYEHSILVNADRFVVTDRETGLPTGDLQHVGATYYDLRVPRPLGKAIQKAPGGGYNHTFCLTKAVKRRSVAFATRLVHPESGRYLEIQTDQPGLLVYTCNRLPNPDPFFEEPAETLKADSLNVQIKGSVDDRILACADMEAQRTSNYDWPVSVLSQHMWDHPMSEPEEEHFFRERGSLISSTISDSETRRPVSNLSAASMRENSRTTGEQQMFDSEVFYRDEAESVHGEFEVPEMIGQPLLEGKNGVTYRNHSGIVLMPQEYPDAPKFSNFPSALIQPTKEYTRTTTYRFGIIPVNPKDKK